MKKKNIKISRCEGLEVYCARDDFDYNCDNTPNNCTECPIMRFMYHDLTTRILADEPASELKKIVEASEAFSGKYDGYIAAKNESLPAEVWTAIYAIRDAYYQCHYTNHNPSEEGYTSRDDSSHRFVKWFCEKRIAQGASLEEIVDECANVFAPGKLIALSPNGELVMFADSGRYMPAVFNNKEDATKFLFDLICRKLQLDIFANVNIFPKKIVTEKPAAGRYSAQVSIYPDSHLFAFYMKANALDKLQAKARKEYYVLQEMDDIDAEEFRNKFIEMVREKLSE